jgi:class 3 adenylate cyclase
MQTNLTPIFDGNRIEKIIAVEKDITKQKNYELQLIKQNEESLRLMDDLRRANKTIDLERQKTRGILLNMMPEEMVEELMGVGYAGPRSFSAATIMFTDFKGFSKSCEHLTPKQIVDNLDFFFSTFDDIIDRHIIEKIKTIGDSYMCVGGIPLRNKSNPIDVILAGLEINNFMSTYKQRFPDMNLPDWQLRIGIHTGALVAGVVGKIKFAYDTWGDAVNVAKRMESADEVGCVNISAETYKYVKDYFVCRYRGSVDIKNHKNIDMYFVDRLLPKYSLDEEGIFPNDTFINILNSI